MAKKAMTAAVSKRALVQRVNRKLAGDRQKLQAVRGKRGRAELGEFIVVDTARGVIVRKKVNPVALARELGALEAWERVEGA